jgi:hypothetical protein
VKAPAASTTSSIQCSRRNVIDEVVASAVEKAT